MEYTKLIYAVEGGVATVSLNSPKNMNAFDETLLDELVAAFGEAEGNRAVRAVILNSTGKNFSGGGDIGAMYMGIQKNDLDFDSSIAKMASVTVCIKKMTKPVIAAVSGAVAGAAFNVALACDFCIAAEDSKFIQAFVGIGLIPDAGGFYLLTRAVGVNKAAELAMSGRPVGAEEAKNLGFVCQTCPPDALAEAAQKLAGKLSVGPALAYAKMKELLYESSFSDFEDYIRHEVAAQTACGASDDFKEGVCAFVEKRRPNFH
ncbi:MAG: enoyl-CoA hydratase-related protein [Oscillibacter sp.]